MAGRASAIVRGLARRRSSRPRVAALTMVRDEAVMLPRWVRYYGDQLGVEHLTVIDHGSTDGSTDGLDCHVIPGPELDGRPFENVRMRFVSRVASRLLTSYDAVIFTDCDEFLIADPDRFGGLTDFVEAHPELPVTGGLGFNVIHRVGVEAPLRADAPLLGQRRHGMFVGRLCKPSLKRIDVPWRLASHGIGAEYRPDPALLLAHFKYADVGELRRVGDLRRAVHEESGLSEGSAWARSGSAQVEELAALLADREPAGLFDPSAYDPSALAVPFPRGWQAAGAREFDAMLAAPLLTLPDRYLGLV